MKPAPFDYTKPTSVADAVALLARHGDQARVLAGGQSLIATLAMRLSQPALLIDISGLGGLRELRIDGDWVEIGAGVTQAELLAWCAERGVTCAQLSGMAHSGGLPPSVG